MILTILILVNIFRIWMIIFYYLILKKLLKIKDYIFLLFLPIKMCKKQKD
jgi:hypothetical protein